jgi:sugar/nucleoside kinase (ribokinase family)
VRPLAVIGNLARDVVDGQPPRVGGAPYYAARALRAIACPARIVTKSAEADRGLVRTLVSVGVPVTWLPSPATSAFSFSYEGDDRSMTIEALGEPWTPEQATAVGRAAWVHAAPLARSDFPPETLAALARGRRLSLDGQGLVRVPETGPLRLDGDFDRTLLRHVRVLKLAEQEAEVLGALEEGGLRALGVPEIVVTLGSRGSLVWAGTRLEHVPAVAVRSRVDPTGAGDVFAVAYLWARHVGEEPVPAARRAASVVSDVLSR